MELIARKTIHELEGDEGLNHLDEYLDIHTERGQNLVKKIQENLGFDSLSYQTLDGLLDAIGINPCDVCTYCWNGEE